LRAIRSGCIVLPVKTNTTAICPKCNGSRKLPHYSAIANGDCFECGATGRVSTTSRRVLVESGPAYRPSPQHVIDTMRVWYKCAKNMEGAWFRDEGESGVGMNAVRAWVLDVDADTAARIVTAFEALEARCT